jgi:protein-disulfide isomerase-like protein with CxxC motif
VTLRFAVTFDYLCPFARNAHEHVLAGLAAGADWEVDFVPFSLAQGHVEPGEPAVWDGDGAGTAPGVLALQVGLAARDTAPEGFLELHRRLFAARHDEGRDLKDRDVLRDVVREAGLDSDELFAVVDDGKPLETLRTEHRWAVDEHEVWGVPIFIAGGRAVFIRVLDRPEGDAALARRRVERLVELIVEEPMLHEFKQTDLPM